MKKIGALFLALIMTFSVFMFNSTSVFATDAKAVLNNAKLYPCKTGIIEVDQRVNEILTELRKTNKDTYSLMRAVYTYITRTQIMAMTRKVLQTIWNFIKTLFMNQLFLIM